MKEKADLETILRAFAVFDGFDGPESDGLWWRTDGEYAPVTLFVNCNDLFFWGAADCERLTPNNIDQLERAATDLKTALSEGDYSHADLLFCCRVRSMRPQGAYYKYLNAEERPLFDACGPERETGFGNPQAPEQAV